MKKLMISSLLTLFLLVPYPTTVSHAENSTAVTSSTITEFYDDNSYSIITITEYINNSILSSKTGSKTITHFNSSDEQVWTYTITGNYTYNGSSSSCTSVSDSYSISNNNWHINSHSCWKSGNTAYGSVTMDYKLLGITINSVSKSLNLSCSPSGVLS